MGEQKPIFALDLSNDGVALWHRKGSQGWAALGRVDLQDPEFERRLIEMRDRAPVRGRAAVVRIPRGEVLLSRVRLGVFEGEAAANHARKQVAELTPYSLDQISYDLGEKGFGNMAPVGVVARRTLEEADTFARSHGFDPVYFTTQYGEKEFPREPRFYLRDQRQSAAAVGWMIPWVAAAAIGMTAGFLGYSWLSAPSSAVTATLDRPPAQETLQEEVAEVVTTPTEESEPEAEQTQIAALTDPGDIADSLSDVAPALPPVAADLLPLKEGSYPELLTGTNPRLPIPAQPNQVRLANLNSTSPDVDPQSTTEKTLALVLSDAYRDLPEVGVNDEVVAALETSMADLILAPEEDQPAIEVTRLTPSTQPVSSDLISTLPLTGETKAQVSDWVTALPDPPPPPVSLVIAEPGTLIPTTSGTLGPGNILIFAGRPQNPPPSRPGSEIEPPPPDPLAGKRPRLREEGFVSPELLAQFQTPEELSPGDLLLASADPDLRVRPSYRPSGLVPESVEPVVSQEIAAALVAPDEDFAPEISDSEIVTAPVTIEPDRTEVAIADVPIAPQEPSDRVDTVAIAEPAPQVDDQPVNVQQSGDDAAVDLLAAADPSLAGKRPSLRPASLEENAPTVLDGLLSLADPELRDDKPRVRPNGLRILEGVPTSTELSPGDILLASADPELRTKARVRPNGLVVLEGFEVASTPPVAESAEAQTETAAADNLATEEATAEELAEFETADAATAQPAEEVASDPIEDPLDPTTQAEPTLLAVADPSLEDERAPGRPYGLQVAPELEADEVETAAPAGENAPAEEDLGPTLLALADPSLTGKRSRSRPTDLTVIDIQPDTGLLALADPSLRGNRSRGRPANLRVIEEPTTPEASEENGLETATRLAVAISPNPRQRPNSIAQIAKRITDQEARDAQDTRTSPSATPSVAKGTSRPTPGQTATTVARAATEKARFSKSRMSLVGVFGAATARRALVRLPTGRYVKVKAGDRVSGWKVAAIGEASLRITKGSRNQTLRVP